MRRARCRMRPLFVARAGWPSNRRLPSVASRWVRSSPGMPPSNMSALRHSGAMALLSRWKVRGRVRYEVFAAPVSPRDRAAAGKSRECVMKRGDSCLGRSLRRSCRRRSSRSALRIWTCPKVRDSGNGWRCSCRLGSKRVVEMGDALTWGGDQLLWNGQPITWGGLTGYVDGDLNPLAAAFAAAEADNAIFAGLEYVVEESQLWRGSHCRAVLLRES